jgi:hypothetical protein
MRQRTRFAARGQCVFCWKSSWVSFSVEGVGLPLKAVWIQGNLPVSWIRSLIKVRLKYPCVTFAPQEVRRMKLFRDCQVEKAKEYTFRQFISRSAYGENIRAGHFAAPRNNHTKRTVKAQMYSGALCKLRQNLAPTIRFVPSCFLEWFIDGNNGVCITEDFHESLVHMFCHYSGYTTVPLKEKSIPVVSCEEACFECRQGKNKLSSSLLWGLQILLFTFMQIEFARKE